MRTDHSQRVDTDTAAHEYWVRIHRGEPREVVLLDVAGAHGVAGRELRAAIERYALRATST